MSSISGSGERILAIINLFTEANPEWTPEDMMARLGYSRTTLYRYLKTLKDAGFLVSLPNAGFTLGPRVTELDFLMRRSDPLIKSGQRHLEALAGKYPGSAFLARWYERKLLCVASEVSAPEPRSSYPRGRPMPLAKGAISRAILAFLPRRQQELILNDHLHEFLSAGRCTSAEDLIAELRDVRREGLAIAYGEVTKGVVGIAAPILVAERSPIAALCFTSNESQIDATRIALIAGDIRRAAQAMSDELAAAGQTISPHRKSA